MAAPSAEHTPPTELAIIWPLSAPKLAMCGYCGGVTIYELNEATGLNAATGYCVHCTEGHAKARRATDAHRGDVSLKCARCEDRKDVAIVYSDSYSDTVAMCPKHRQLHEMERVYYVATTRKWLTEGGEKAFPLHAAGCGDDPCHCVPAVPCVQTDTEKRHCDAKRQARDDLMPFSLPMAEVAAPKSNGYIAFVTDIPVKPGQGPVSITLTWLGPVANLWGFTALNEYVKVVKKFHEFPIAMQFVGTDFTRLGSPAEIAAGRGVDARLAVFDSDRVSPLLKPALDKKHSEWYYHEKGEDEARKHRILFHVTIGKGGYTREETAALPPRFNVTDMFVKNKTCQYDIRWIKALNGPDGERKVGVEAKVEWPPGQPPPWPSATKAVATDPKQLNDGYGDFGVQMHSSIKFKEGYTMAGGRTAYFYADTTTTVAQLKQMIFERVGVPVKDQAIWFGNEQPDDAVLEKIGALRETGTVCRLKPAAAAAAAAPS